MGKPIHPILLQVKSYLEKEGISIADFACAILDYLPDGSKYTQGSGEEITCTRKWKVGVYRWFAGEHTPRKERLLAIQNWLNDQPQ